MTKRSDLTPKQRQGSRNRERGVEVERKIRHVLEANGYAVCRAAGSHGVADLIAWLPGGEPDDALWINVKGSAWPGPDERRASSHGAPKYAAVAIVWPKRERPKAAQIHDGEIRCEHERTAWIRQMVDAAARARKKATSPPPPSSSPSSTEPSAELSSGTC